MHVDPPTPYFLARSPPLSWGYLSKPLKTDGRASWSPAPASLSPVVEYHGLARRYLIPLGFLMRPLLNGGTLGGRTNGRRRSHLEASLRRNFIMSNRTLLEQARRTLHDLRKGTVTPESASLALRGITSALETLPYPLLRELDSLCDDLQIAHWFEDEGMLSDREHLLAKVETCLGRVHPSN